MPELIKKAAAWLGLVNDDRYDYDEESDEEFSEPVYPTRDRTSADDQNRAVEHSTVTRLPDRRPPAEAVVVHAAHELVPSGDLTRIITVHPRNYNEARTVGEHFRDGVPVIMNLTDMDDSDAKRLVDFAAGLSFGLRGSIERVTRGVFLLSPRNVDVTAEDKERIAGGFYNQS